MDKNLYVKHKDKNLFVALYEPGLLKKNKAFIICHPFAEEKKNTQKFLVDLAKNLRSNGFTVVLFDLSGCGDSEGELSDASVSSWVDDIRYIFSFINDNLNIDYINFIGLRFGAYLGLLSIQRNIAFKNIIMIEPVLNAIKYFRNILKNKLIKELTNENNTLSKSKQLFDELNIRESIDFKGYEISKSFFTDLTGNQEMFNIDQVLDSDTNIAILNISIMDKVPSEIEKIILCGKKINKDVLYKHIKHLPFWNSNEDNTCKGIEWEILRICTTL